jgi:hypothetical protein
MSLVTHTKVKVERHHHGLKEPDFLMHCRGNNRINNCPPSLGFSN